MDALLATAALELPGAYVNCAELSALVVSGTYVNFAEPRAVVVSGAYGNCAELPAVEVPGAYVNCAEVVAGCVSLVYAGAEPAAVSLTGTAIVALVGAASSEVSELPTTYEYTEVSAYAGALVARENVTTSLVAGYVVVSAAVDGVLAGATSLVATVDVALVLGTSRDA